MNQEQAGTALQETTPQPLELSHNSIEVVKTNIDLCEQLVREVLEPDVDFGTVPGVERPFLWDPGAAKIMAAFNCYPVYLQLDHDETPRRISITYQVELISRQTRQVIATGIGAASTAEKKHQYIYKTQDADGDQLLHTICKMAAKRADVDATQSLPGVAATLHKLFHGKQTTTQKPDWNWFWAQLKPLGVDGPKAHDILQVGSIKKDWCQRQGKTLDDALATIKTYLEAQTLQSKPAPRPYPDTQAPHADRPQDELFPGNN